jgi:hypothetical protein
MSFDLSAISLRQGEKPTSTLQRIQLQRILILVAVHLLRRIPVAHPIGIMIDPAIHISWMRILMCNNGRWLVIEQHEDSHGNPCREWQNPKMM